MIVTEGFKAPEGAIYHAIEAPKGELGFYCVSNGSNRPYRMHCRPPSFINLQVLPRLAKGAISAFALTEVDAGSDPANMHTHAEP